MFLEPRAQPAGAHRHHDVVDGRAERVLDRLDRLERRRSERETSVRGDRRVEGRVRRRQRRQRAARLALGAALPADVEHARRAVRAVHRGLGWRRRRAPGYASTCRTRERCACVNTIARPGLRTRLAPARASTSASDGAGAGFHSSSGGGTIVALGRLVEHHREQLGSGRAVDRRVVHLREDAEPVVGQPLDHVRLPQRAGAVERAADDAGDEVGELLVAARRGRCGVAHVEVEIEVRVVDPERVVEVHRHVAQAPAQRLEGVQPRLDLVPPGGEGVVVRVVWFLEDRQARHMAELRRGLHVEERGVETGELLHGRGSRSPTRPAMPV